MEDLQQKVSVNDRTIELAQLAREQHTVAKFREFIAEFGEMCYLAGANKLNITEQQVGKMDLDNTGQTLTKARNFIKDKGFKI